MTLRNRLLAGFAAASLAVGPANAQVIIGGGGGSGSGSVTSVATGACLTGGPITSTGTVSGTYVNRAVTTTSDTIVSSDACKIVTYANASAIAVTLPQATGSFASGFSFDVENKAAGLVTITPTTSTINGAATLKIPANSGCTIWSDGTNWQVSACTALSGILANANAWSAQQSNCITTLTAVSNVYTPDGTCNNYKLVLAATNTLANWSAGMTPGTAGTLEIDQDGTGSRTIGTYGSQLIAPGGTSTITLSTAASAKDMLSYIVLDSTHVWLAVGGLNASH